MKDPCQRCFVAPCCKNACNIRILYTATVYFDYSVDPQNFRYKMETVWNRNTKIIPNKAADYIEKLMDHYLVIINRKREKQNGQRIRVKTC
jgi:hypothetical protein